MHFTKVSHERIRLRLGIFSIGHDETMAVVIQRHWRRCQSIRHAAANVQLRESRCRCCVCHDETASVVLCENGHPTCTGCDACIEDQACPVCRQPREPTPDATVEFVGRVHGLRFRCATCNVSVHCRDVEFHRAWCARHQFECPVDGCHALTSDVHRHVVRTHPTILPSRAHTLLVGRFCSDAVLLVDDVVVVLSFHTDRSGSVSDLLSGSLNLYMRAFYPGPDARPLTALVSQKRVADVRAGTALETFRVDVVSPVLASRERLFHSAYVPHVVPRCVMNHGVAMGTPPLELKTPVVDLIRYGVHDAPVTTRPERRRPVHGIPVAIVEILFDRAARGSIGDAYEV